MSLYAVQKCLYELNREPAKQAAYLADRHAAVAQYDVTDEEARGLTEPDIGLLFHLGVNGQILMHFAAFHQIAWVDYMQMMRDGLGRYGPVRAGVYVVTGYEGIEAHERRLGQVAPGAAQEGTR